VSWIEVRGWSIIVGEGGWAKKQSDIKFFSGRKNQEKLGHLGFFEKEFELTCVFPCKIEKNRIFWFGHSCFVGSIFPEKLGHLQLFWKKKAHFTHLPPQG